MSEREWYFYLEDMIRFAEKILSYTSGMDQAIFVASALTYDATLRNLELVGEAATHIPANVRKASPYISWRMIIATRNRLLSAAPMMDGLYLRRKSGHLRLVFEIVSCKP